MPSRVEMILSRAFYFEMGHRLLVNNDLLTMQKRKINILHYLTFEFFLLFFVLFYSFGFDEPDRLCLLALRFYTAAVLFSTLKFKYRKLCVI